MITDNNDQLEDQVRGILEEAGWAAVRETDLGRIEVIAYRACVEAPRQASPMATCCSAPIHGPSFASRKKGCICGSSILSFSRFEDDKFDEDPWAGSTRA